MKFEEEKEPTLETPKFTDEFIEIPKMFPKNTPIKVEPQISRRDYFVGQAFIYYLPLAYEESEKYKRALFHRSDRDTCLSAADCAIKAADALIEALDNNNKV